jgi:hypothetical protein
MPHAQPGTMQNDTNALLTLRGHEPRPAGVELTYRPPRTRSVQALLSLLGFWALIPLVLFIPPHLPWALAAFAAGIYFAWRSWTGEYVVHSLAGSCPRCGSELSLKPGSRIRLPHALTCYHCHHHPVLQVQPQPA